MLIKTKKINFFIFFYIFNMMPKIKSRDKVKNKKGKIQKYRKGRILTHGLVLASLTHDLLPIMSFHLFLIKWH